MKHVAIAAALLLAAVPFASAEVTVTAADGDIEMVPGESYTIPVNITVSCDEFIMGGAQSFTFSLESDAPASWNPSGDDVEIAAGADCVTSQAVSGSGELTLSPGDDAVGLDARTIKVFAVSSAHNATDDRAGTIWVVYQPGHTLSTDVDFPYTWEGGDQLAFNVTIDVQANSDTMVMFFPEMGPSDGSISGLEHKRFFFSQGEGPSKTLPVTWTPPSGAWESANITFRNYSHCLTGGELDPCEEQQDEIVTWTIQNAAPGGGDPDDREEDSPGLGPVLLIALLGAALVAYRRR